MDIERTKISGGWKLLALGLAILVWANTIGVVLTAMCPRSAAHMFTIPIFALVHVALLACNHMTQE